MLRQIATFITVIDVIVRLGYEPRKHLTWAVGAQMADWYTRNCGHAPPKDLRAKTNGEGGSHCFAHYPECFFKVIEGFVRLYDFERARQGELTFGHGEGIRIDYSSWDNDGEGEEGAAG